MFGDSIPIPAVRIGPVATEAASTAKSISAVIFFFAVIVVLIGVGMASDAKGDAGTIGGMIFWSAVICSVAMRYLKTARRATAAIERAKADPSSQWFLSGKMIVGTDAGGVPSPALTFKISGQLRKTLLAVPAATVVEHSKLAP